MQKIINSRNRHVPHLVTSITFALYVAAFSIYHNYAGIGLASLAIIPVITGGWYFGIRGGMLTAGMSIIANVLILGGSGSLQDASIINLDNSLRISAIFIIAIVVGRLGTVSHERLEALQKLREYEKNRETHTKFLELLNKITSNALEADSLQSTLNILVEKIAILFEADDSFFSFWDETERVPIPVVAYGPMKDIYPYMQFESGEQTLQASILKNGHPIAVMDVENSPYISPKVASIFPSRSMLGLPLIVQERKLGALVLGYNNRHSFDPNQIARAEITAEQVAIVLSKAQLLEEERKQVKQLTALHDVAVTSIQANNEDELIERVTGIIGKNLFPDNFGILLYDEKNDELCAHPSYHFSSAGGFDLRKIQLGVGITGQVAMTGKPQRIGYAGRVEQYLLVDERTVSEVCVPIKFKDQLLGVINAESSKRDAFTADDERLLITFAGQLAMAMEQLRKSKMEREWLNQLAHSNDLIYSITQITTQIERELTTDEIIRTLGNELRNMGLTCIMAVNNISQESFTINYTSIEPPSLEKVDHGLGYPLLKYTFSRERLNRLLSTRDILHPGTVPDPEDEVHILFTDINKPGVAEILKGIGFTANTQVLRLPVLFEESLLGILWIWGDFIRTTDLPIMSILAKQIGVSLERARLFQEVQSLALTDPLTGLHNRRNIFELGRIEFSRALRMSRSFCCMMLDLDHFKQINDNYGHQAGDQVLHEFAQRCEASVREVDLVGRYGGEELVIFLPETDLTTAKQVAERLRKSIAETPIYEISVTVSIGVAAKDGNTMDLETLIARADQAMYIAKHKGRNRIAVSI